MALSQKHEGKCLVPWFCSAEWHFVYNKIYGVNNNENTRKEALDILNIWKSRTPFLPRGVEGTYIILKAALLETKTHDAYNLKLLLSSSIMRFLNICAAYNKFQGTFYETANKMKIPEWLINLRHEIAHGQLMPSLDVLDRALKFSLEWLHQEYWKITAPEIKDFIDDTKFESDRNELLRSSIQPLVSNYCHITLLTHPNWNYNTIQDIPDEDTRQLFLQEIKSITNFHQFDDNSALQEVLKIIWEKIDEILKEYPDLETKYQILVELLVEDVFLGNIDDREKIFREEYKLPKNFMILWENMFTNFNKEMLGELIKKLLEICSTENCDQQMKNIAAEWILGIATGLGKSMYIKKIVQEINKTGLKPKKVINSTLEEKLRIKYGKKKVLNFKSSLEVPNIISDAFKFKEFVLKNPTEYTKIFISELLDLNEQLRESPRRELILNLLNVYINNKSDYTFKCPVIHIIEDLNSFTSYLNGDVQIKSVEDINSSVPCLNGDTQTKMETDSISNGTSSETSEQGNEEQTSNNIWRKVTETNFEKCPIGILPWQSTAMNPFLV